MTQALCHRSFPPLEAKIIYTSRFLELDVIFVKIFSEIYQKTKKNSKKLRGKVQGEVPYCADILGERKMTGNTSKNSSNLEEILQKGDRERNYLVIIF